MKLIVRVGLASALIAGAGQSISGFNAQAQESDDVAVTAAGDPTSGAARLVYDPEFFSRFAPQTARDMLRNVPGFNVQGGQQRRGFGQGGGNVLINGRRVSGKSNSALDELDNLSADQVLRIEILDGASLDIPGLSGQVANVVKRTDAFSGNWQWSPQFRADTPPVYDRGRVSFSGETANISYSLGFRINGGRGAGEGLERVLDANGDVLDLRSDRFGGGGRAHVLNGSLTWLGRTGSVLNLNLNAELDDFGNREVSQRSGPGQPDRTRFAEFSGQGHEIEIGADYEFGLGSGSLKVIGLHSLGSGTDLSTVEQFNNDLSAASGSRFVSRFDEGESILRGEYAFPEFIGGEWQLAAEGAFNYLEVDSALLTRLATGVFGDEQSFAGSRVEEKRAETSLTYNRAVSDAIDLQLSVSGEYSELSQSGENGKTRDFVRPKGFASLAWKLTEDSDFNFRLAREVGQLRFGDFIASTNIAENTSNFGNVDLVPEQAWVAEIEYNRRFGDWGAVTAQLYYRDIEDIVDQIPILDTDGVTIIGEAPGNIESAWRTGAAINGTLNLDPAGLEGLKLDLQIEVNESEVRDPLTGDTRRVSGTELIEVEVGLRHDVPGTDWAWGGFYEQFRRERDFRLDQVSQFIATPGFAGAYVEHKDLFGMTARLQVGNLLNSNEDFGRTVFVNRRDGPVDFSEFRSMEFAKVINFRLSGSF